MNGGEVFLVIMNVFLMICVGGGLYVFVVKPRMGGGSRRSATNFASANFASPMPRPGENMSVGLAGADSASSAYVSPMVIELGGGTRNKAAIDRARNANAL